MKIIVILIEYQSLSLLFELGKGSLVYYALMFWKLISWWRGFGGWILLYVGFPGLYWRSEELIA